MSVEINGVECNFFPHAYALQTNNDSTSFVSFPLLATARSFFYWHGTFGLVDVNINKVGDLWNSQYLNFDWFAVKRSRL